MISAISMRKMTFAIQTTVPVLKEMVVNLKNGMVRRNEETGYIHQKRVELLDNLSRFESTLDVLARQKIEDQQKLSDLQKSIAEAMYLPLPPSPKKNTITPKKTTVRIPYPLYLIFKDGEQVWQKVNGLFFEGKIALIDKEYTQKYNIIDQDGSVHTSVSAWTEYRQISVCGYKLNNRSGRDAVKFTRDGFYGSINRYIKMKGLKV
jgi:hypothetical protein